MENYILLVVGMFFTGIVDAVAGEGGLISTPLLIIYGLPPTTAVATNKAVAMLGNIAACTKFYKGKKIRFRELKLIIPVMLIGTFLGIEALKVVSNDFMGKFVPVILSLLIVFTIVFKKSGLKERDYKKFKYKKAIVCMSLLAVGVYDGFFGAASGAFMTMIFMIVLGFEMVDSLATSRFMNLLICTFATILLIPTGLLDYQTIVIAAAGRMCGAYVGGHIAITKGSAYIKPIFLIAVILATVQLFLKFYS